MSDPKRRELPTFGDEIRKARMRLKGMTQAELGTAVAEKLTSGSMSVVQSNIARLEDGRVLPPKAVLVALSEVLKVPHDTLVAAIVRDRLAQPGREDVVFPLEKGVMTLTQLAEWEGSGNHTEVWLVAERHVDGHIRDFYDAVSRIIRRGGTFVFFLPPGFEEQIESYKREIRDDATREGTPLSFEPKLLYFPLTSDQRGLMAAPFVVANPAGGGEAPDGERYPNGYLILNDARGDPSVGIRMSYEEARHRVSWLKTFKYKAEAMAREGTL